MQLSNTTVNAIATLSTLEVILSEAAEWVQAIDQEFVQPIYQSIGHYIQTDALSDFSTLIATIIVYSNKALVWAGYNGFLNTPVTDSSEVEVFVEPSIDVIPTEIFAPVVYALEDVFQVQEIKSGYAASLLSNTFAELTIVEVASSANDELEALKLTAKQLGIKGYNLYRDSNKLQIKINQALTIQHK